MKSKMTFFQEKYWIFLLIFTILVFFQTCNMNKKISKLEKTIQDVSLKTEEKINEQFKIEGLKISKRFLYDNNAIIRTSIRPDDRMNQYDEEIKKLEK